MASRGPVFIRRAAAGDQPAITRIVRSARINPMGLRWARFIVAESGGRVVGTVQLKPHGDGSRELASLAVVPERQGEGIAGALIGAVLRGAAPPIYLICASSLGEFYPHFGFRKLEPAEMPRDLGRMHRAVNALVPLLSPRLGLLVMRWDGPYAPASTRTVTPP